MFRIIEGCLFEGKTVADAWDVRVWRHGGHREVSARQRVIWREVDALSPRALADHLAAGDLLDAATLEAEAAKRKADKLKSNANRAKTMCRRVIKTEGFDELLTLTYRENQTDRALCKHHFAQWLRRMKIALPGFRFCASFEQQKRGSMHVHLATHKLPKHVKYKGAKIQAWRLGTEVWRSVVGADNGMCFVGGKTRHGGYRRNLSLAKMAAYVSKYIMKDYADCPDDSNRYQRSLGCKVAKPELYRFDRVTLADLIPVVFELGEGDVVISHSVSEADKRYWLCTEGYKNR